MSEELHNASINCSLHKRQTKNFQLDKVLHKLNPSTLTTLIEVNFQLRCRAVEMKISDKEKTKGYCSEIEADTSNQSAALLEWTKRQTGDLF